MPQVSVVVPVFNAARFIGDALRSVFGQTFRDFDVTVVDDGSEDRQELLGALDEWKDRLRYVRQPNRGPASARNAGIARSTGRLVAFLDADDEWLPEKLARQVAYFERYPETGLLHTSTIDAHGPRPAQAGAPRHVFCDLYHTVCSVRTLTVMVPRHVLDAVGGFDERRDIHIEDWDLWLRIAASYPFGYLDEPLARYRRGGWMSSQIDRTYRAQLLVMEKNAALCARACDSYRLDPAACTRRRRYVLHRDWGYDRLAAGDGRGAREQLGRALAHSPFEPRTAALYLSTILPLRRRAATTAAVKTTAAVPDSGGNDVSLVHDTAYRRLRRRAIRHLHNLDDTVSRSSRGRKRVLFDAASPMSLAIFAPLYRQLRRDPRIELWFTAHGRVWQPRQIYSAEGISENVISPARAAWLKVDVYVNTDFWDMTWLHRRTRRVHLFHGVAGKYGLDAPVDLAPTIAAFDCLMFANADRRQRYIDAGLLPDDEIRASLVGYPKVDALVDGSLDRRRITRHLGLDERIPTVIYAPTWSPYSSLNSMGETVIERLAVEGLQVIVKLHDRSYDRGERGAGGIDWAARLTKYDSHRLIRVARGGDSSPLLVAADVLVSDHSSIAFEYMLLDRPIVLLEPAELARRADINPQKVQLLQSAAHVLRDPAAIASAVSATIDNRQDLSFVRRSIASQLFYEAGTATDRALALIHRLLDLPAAAGHESSAGTDSGAASQRTLSAVG